MTNTMDAIILAVHFAVASIIENLRLWMGAFLAPFDIDDESTFTPTILIAIVGCAGLFWCAPRAHKLLKLYESCKSIPSVRSLVPPTVPASFNSVEEALGAVSAAGHWAVTSFYGSSLYGGYRKVMDWMFPGQPEDKLWRMIIICILCPIFYFTLAAPCRFLKGLIVGFNNTQRSRSLECGRLTSNYYAFGSRHQTRADKRAFYQCEGELYGFDLQDMWKQVQDHPCLNGDIFHLAVLTVAVVLLVVFLLGIYIQEGAFIADSRLQGAADGRDGTVECNGSETVPQDKPGHVQEAEETIPDKAALRIPTPETKVETPERETVTPAEGQLKAGQENKTGVRVVKKRVPRRPNAATLEAESAKRENDRLLQKLKETEEQLTRQSTMRSLVEGRLATFQKLAGVVADKELYQLLGEFDKLENKCKAVAGDNTQEPRIVDLKGICYSDFPQLLERAKDLTFSNNDKKDQERIAQSMAKEELERKLESSSKVIQSLQAELENRPVQEPLTDPDVLASAKLEAMRQQHQLEVDAIKAQHNEQIIACSSQNQKLETDIQEAKAIVESAIAAKDNEIAAQSKDIGDKDQVIQRQAEIIWSLERDATSSREQANRLAEALRKESYDAFQVLTARTQADIRAEGAEANVATLQKAYDASRDDTARLQVLLDTARKEKEALSEECLHKLQVAEQKLILLQEASRAKEADNQQRIKDLKSEGDKLLGETKKLRKSQPQAGPPPELADAQVKIIEHEAEISALKDRLQQVQTPTRDDRMKQLVEQLRAKAQALEKDKMEQLVRSSKKVKDLEEQLRQKTIALSNANSQGGAMMNPGS